MSCFLCCFDRTSKSHKHTDIESISWGEANLKNSHDKPPKGHKLTDIVSSSCGEAIDMVEIHTGVSVYDRKLIKETAEIIFSRLHLENKGVDFLIKFFKTYPHHQRFFKAFRNIPPDELVNLPKLENHGRKVMDQIAILVQHIDDHVFIREQVTGLQERHLARRVRSRQFKDMLTAFVDYVKLHTGSKFTPQHESAWNSFINHVLAIADEAVNKKFDESKASANEPKITADEPGENEAEGDNDVISSEDDVDHGDAKDDEVTDLEVKNKLRMSESGDENVIVNEMDVVLEKLDEAIDKSGDVVNKENETTKGSSRPSQEESKVKKLANNGNIVKPINEGKADDSDGKGTVKSELATPKTQTEQSDSIVKKANNNNQENRDAKQNSVSKNVHAGKSITPN